MSYNSLIIGADQSAQHSAEHRHRLGCLQNRSPSTTGEFCRLNERLSSHRAPASDAPSTVKAEHQHYTRSLFFLYICPGFLLTSPSFHYRDATRTPVLLQVALSVVRLPGAEHPCSCRKRQVRESRMSLPISTDSPIEAAARCTLALHLALPTLIGSPLNPVHVFAVPNRLGCSILSPASFHGSFYASGAVVTPSTNRYLYKPQSIFVLLTARSC